MSPKRVNCAYTFSALNLVGNTRMFWEEFPAGYKHGGFLRFSAGDAARRQFSRLP